MSCDSIQAELVGYHFGTLEAAPRAAVEAHLPACSACVAAFVALKHELELAPATPLPSKAARDRLRRAVIAELQGPEPRPVRRWERPVAFGFAGAAVLVAMLLTHSVSRPRPPLPRLVEPPAATQGR